MKISNIESFSSTNLIAKVLVNWEDDRSTLGFLGSRVCGFITTPFTCLIDAVVHTVLFSGKAITGTFVTPYNFIVGRIDPKYKISDELSLGSAFVHFSIIGMSIGSFFYIPFVALIEPKFAEYMSDRAFIFMSIGEQFASALEPLQKLAPKT